VLGHLNPTALLEGAMPIARGKAEEAVARVAEPLGLSRTEAAWGILTVLATNVTMAMRTITIERGYDPREFTLIAFGGMGPTIAGRIVGELGIGRILVPPDPGTFSAFGMLVSDVQQSRSVTRMTRLDVADAAELDKLFTEMEESAIAELVLEKFARQQVATLRSAGMRYRGQSYEVSVPVDALRGPADIAALAQRFHEAHRRRYGHMAESEAVEIVNFQVTAIGKIPKPQFHTAAIPARPQQPRPADKRAVNFGAGDLIETPVFRRAALPPGASLEGPAIVEEKTSTIVLYPGQSARVDGYLNVEIEALQKR
jgi:N-methylhydantoinase A